MSHLKEEIMNFKKVTTIITGSLGKQLKKDGELRFSPGMQVAWDLSKEIVSWHFTLPMVKYAELEIFRFGKHACKEFQNVFHECSRVNIEMAMIYEGYIRITANFYRGSEKETLLTLYFNVAVSSGFVSSSGTSSYPKRLYGM